MKTKIITLANWLSKKTTLIVKKLETPDPLAQRKSKFVNLAPTDEADQSGVYAEALNFATDDVDVSNIALTGPYGSGKSSIIRSFLKTYGRPALHISLAAFLPEADDKHRSVSKQEIERSILQQLLYGADAEKLPLSRFKRIRSPGVWSLSKSFFILIGIAALLRLFVERSTIFDGTYFALTNISNLIDILIFGLACAFLWTTIHHFYKASFGVSLKSISLKNMELGLSSIDQESILNRHLDEIIYFFQSTQYDLVIVEDLDRFDDSDIFVTLREINSLVNGNSGVKRRIRFLYALRDDMFANTDRTKFFEFIIPVIPIINSSNSIDMVLEQGKRLALDKRLDNQFLREVSRYLNDLRLIHNIFNEYAIYIANLETDGENNLDANKLLAVLIYKNVYPRDFERLHRGQGRLATIFGQKDAFVAAQEHAYKAEIAKLERDLQEADRQISIDLKELRRGYAMAVIEKLPHPIRSISLDRQIWISLAQLPDHEALEQIIAGLRIQYRDFQGRVLHYDSPDIQADVDENYSYKEREQSVENKSGDFKISVRRRIGGLRDKIKSVRTNKFSILLRNSSEDVEEMLKTLGDGGELARFLLMEGYLDDSYYQYTSLFHSGRLSANDNKYLIQIRAFNTPDPNFPIDNPKEVIEGMRDDDFGVSYVLNVKLVDTLLEGNGNKGRIEKLFKLLSTDFSKHHEFFEAYYATGTHVADLLLGLSRAWPDFVSACLDSPMSTVHAAQMIEHLSTRTLASLSAENSDVRKFVAQHLEEILSLAEGLDPAKLEPLKIEAESLSAIEEHSQVVRALVENGHYRLTLPNLDYILDRLLGRKIKEVHKNHYTSIRSIGNQALIRRIELEFETYLTEVLLKLDEDVEEDVSSILAVMSHDELEDESVEAFVAKQSFAVPSLENVPTQFQSMLFRIAKIKATWTNCLIFIETEAFDADSLVKYLNDDNVRSELLSSSIPDGKREWPLRQFIFEANGLENRSYREYVRAMPNILVQFPGDLIAVKRRILVEERKITFDEHNLESLNDDVDLQVAFVAMNIRRYLSKPNAIPIDDDFREKLLEATISDDEKLAVIGLLDLSILQDLPERAAIVGPILARTNAILPSLTSEAIRAIILNSKPVNTQIVLFNKFQNSLNVSEVRGILSSLPRPYNEITTGWSRPRIKPTDANRELVEWLDRRNVISSFGSAVLSDDIVIYLYRK